jgi:hypothetical protein
MDEKTKKKHVEKRGTRKKKDSVSVSTRPAATKKKAKKKPKLTEVKGTKPSQPMPTFEQVRLRAYFISEQRRNAGIEGDEHGDWLRAERELREELLTQRISIER